MSNLTLFEIAFAGEPRPGAGSTALLALRRFFRRSLKHLAQMGAGLLSLFLIASLTAHSPASAESTPAEPTPAKPMSMSVPHRGTNRLLNPSLDPTFSSTNSHLSGQPPTALPVKGKPFQLLRPKMTHHRLTTSRFSIPADRTPSVANLSESK